MSPVSWDFTVTYVTGMDQMFLAERVGFEPTCPCGQDAFEAPPLRPLRYLSALSGPC